MYYCLSCNKELSGRQRKYCSNNCKNIHYFKSGKLVNFQKRMAYNRKITLINMFGGCCQSCGYKKCLRALTFHHNDRKTKKFVVNHSTLQSKNWELILNEVKKCSLLCSNCHIEFHSNEDNTYTFDETDLKEYQIRSKKLEPVSSYCKTCNKEYIQTTNQSKYCSIKCGSISHRKVNRPTKEILLNQISELGYKGTGRLYSVTDNTIRKWVRFYEQYE